MNSELSDWVNFYSELEWEHGGDGKNGKIPVEQAFLDFKIDRAAGEKALDNDKFQITLAFIF